VLRRIRILIELQERMGVRPVAGLVYKSTDLASRLTFFLKTGEGGEEEMIALEEGLAF